MYDYEIEEIRRIRQQISNENKNDLNTLVEYYRQIENELRNSGKYKFIETTSNSNQERSSQYNKL